MTERLTLCLYCGETNVPTVYDKAQGKHVTVEHDDKAHGNKPCLGSGK